MLLVKRAVWKQPRLGRSLALLAVVADAACPLQLLIEYGTDINAPDLQGNSPLHYAASWGKLPLVELLMGLGCLHLVKNNEGFSAQEYAFS